MYICTDAFRLNNMHRDVSHLHMFNSLKRDELYFAILDTEDGSFEFLTQAQIEKCARKNIPIKNIMYHGGKISGYQPEVTTIDAKQLGNFYKSKAFRDYDIKTDLRYTKNYIFDESTTGHVVTLCDKKLGRIADGVIVKDRGSSFQYIDFGTSGLIVRVDTESLIRMAVRGSKYEIKFKNIY